MGEAISRLRLPTDPGTPAQTVLGVVLGTTFTFCLFMGMAHFAATAPASPTPEIEDLRVVALPFQPPPPPQITPTEPAPATDISTVSGFDLAPSDSPVKIAVSPPNFDELTPTVQLAPPAVIQIGRLYGEFKPRTGPSFDLQHIYQKSEVDTLPTALYRAQPPIASRHFRDTNVLRLSLLFVVEASGEITNLRILKTSGNPEVDAIVMETVEKGWGFSPAVKKGRKVRCFLDQPFQLRMSRGSRFEANN
jgi:TonB family protein